MIASAVKCLIIVSIHALSAARSDELFTPIVLWHGAGEKSSTSAELQRQIKEALPGVYVMSMRIGDTEDVEVQNSYFMHPDDQIEFACSVITNDSHLTNGFNAIGLSQGAQFLRGVIQRCPQAKVKNFISMGGQHQGVYGIPWCAEWGSEEICNNLRESLNNIAYMKILQMANVQLTFWHNPLKEEDYRSLNSFISDLNNELVINQDYIERLQKLEKLVLVKFDNDTVVEPVVTEWFGFYKPGQSVEIQLLEESNLYIKDQLGLRQMNEESKIYFISNPGGHVMFEWEWFKETILIPYLS